MNNMKLIVKVVNAHDLMPNDGQCVVNSFVELHFDRHRFRTTVKENDLNPYWNEQFYFNIFDPSILPGLNLEAHVYHINRTTGGEFLIDKVKIPATSFFPFPDALTYNYPLVQGELGLKVFFTNVDTGVPQTKYLYVRVVRGSELPAMDVVGYLDPFVEVRVGNFKGVTKHLEKNQNPEWNHVFAFSREWLQSTTTIEVVVKDKDILKDSFVGVVRFDIHKIWSRVATESPLAPKWYKLEDKEGNKIEDGKLMLAIWFGTENDRAFVEATNSNIFDPYSLRFYMSANLHVGI